MKEEFLHYLWKYKLFNTSNLRTQTNEKVEVINPGLHNMDAGPDFFNAKIKIGETTWAGNVEIHLKSSDWYQHQHHTDKAYDNVILQVVYQHDKDVYLSNNSLVPTIEIQFDEILLKNYEKLIDSESWIACEKELNTVDEFLIQKWIETLMIERLEDKALRIKQQLKQTQNNWEETFYRHLARNFGFKLNAEPFELLARSLPLKVLAKHKNNLMQIEALLFGQAGFLNEETGDDYYLKLKREYQFLNRKFQLKPIAKHLWKFLRSRPGNFPTVRIAQFAALIFQSKSLFSKIMDEPDAQKIRQMLQAKPSEYWESHYHFNKKSVKKTKPLGQSAIQILLINTVVPFLFVYGKHRGKEEFCDRAVGLLSQIKPENNSIILKWERLGLKPNNAFESQALIQLKNKYCTFKKCLQCQIGSYIIKNIQ
jgi:FPC/CPF motif-containing protein YcgG